MLQFFSFPGQFRYMAQEEPENAYLQWPLTFLSFLVILAVQICVICFWKLVNNLINKELIAARLLYVNLSIYSLGFIWIIIAVGFILLIRNADDPGLPVVIAVIESGLTMVLLLYFVYKKILIRNILDLKTYDR